MTTSWTLFEMVHWIQVLADGTRASITGSFQGWDRGPFDYHAVMSTEGVFGCMRRISFVRLHQTDRHALEA